MLTSIGFENVTVVGDTRFDRVYAIAAQARDINEVKAFVGDNNCLVAGSTWPPDEDLLITYINNSQLPVKYIIAPHEIDNSHIARIENGLQNKTVRFSQWKQNPSKNYQVLIIDNVGMLSSLYKYGKVAYIGGGFGKGIHNILEASTFGLPVLFGPNYTRFGEAVELCKQQGAFPINNYKELEIQLNKLFTEKSYLKITQDVAYNFVKENVGATKKIVTHIMS